MKRIAVVLALFLITATWTVPAAEAGKRPNVLLITVDDLSTDLSIYGNEQVVTPNFARLAKRSTRFDSAHAQAPSCNPSRTSMLTGLTPDSTGVSNNDVFFRTVLPDVVTLPQYFRERGYFTVNFGKVFHGADNKEWDDPAAWDLSRQFRSRKRGSKGPGRNVTKGKVSWARWVAAKGKDTDQADGRVAVAAVAALEELLPGRQPFFLAVGFHRPHSPFIAPKRYFDLYKLGRIELHQPPEPRSVEEELAISDPRWEAFQKMTLRDQRELLRGYYACVSFIDAQLGLILDALDRLGGWENTIVVLTSDHGFHLGQHEFWGKNTLFERSVRVPLLIRAPGKRLRPHRSPRPVELVDLYPTLIELAGLKPAKGLEGRSLVPLLRNPTRSWSEGAYSQIDFPNVEGRTVRTKRWRYTEWNGGTDGRELYDHNYDSDEYYNLAEEPEFTAVRAELAALLAAGR